MSTRASGEIVRDAEGTARPVAGPTSEIGDELYALATELYPICRSITGDGVRDTLDRLARHVPLERRSVASGMPVLDWVVPREWRLRDACIKTLDGRRVVDFTRNNLHVVSYSSPVRGRFTFDELRPHLHSLPAQPDLVPYRTSYYSETWGFCVSHTQLEGMAGGTYDVVIDSELVDGSLEWGEALIPGESTDEFLLSAHICHPSLANDNCSGLAVLALLARELRRRPRRYSYRILFAPGTIGAIAWLSQNRGTVARIRHGLVLSCLGDGGGPTYKRTRCGTAQIDRAVEHVLRHSGLPARVVDFSPYGYDERQYGSPGFNLPVGLFQRSAFGEFPEYHTSADDLHFIRPAHLARSFGLLHSVIDTIENDRRYANLSPFGEPQLGRRGLYAGMGGEKVAPATNMALLWTLNQSDGQHSLLDIADRAGLPFHVILDAQRRLSSAGLLDEVVNTSGC